VFQEEQNPFTWRNGDRNVNGRGGVNITRGETRYTPPCRNAHAGAKASSPTLIVN